MLTDLVVTLKNIFNDFLSYIPPGFFLSVAAGCVGQRQHWDVYTKEFIGSVLMIGFTFSAGKWIGQNSIEIAWTFHAIGVIAADYFGGGQQVNPAVTLSMWALGKCDYTEAFVRVAGQMGGGLISFPLFHALAETLKWEPLGGPEFNMSADADAFLSEYFSTFLLMWAIYIVNWEFNFGQYHYIIKQTLTAVAIRALIEFFPTAGPAMNPMLGTCWDVFGVGSTFEFPSDNEHYFVYWVAPFLAALAASVSYAVYNGDRVFGYKLPIGPLKSGAPKVKKN